MVSGVTQVADCIAAPAAYKPYSERLHQPQAAL